MYRWLNRALHPPERMHLAVTYRWAHPGDEDKKQGLPCPGKAVRAGRAEAEEESQEEGAEVAHVLSPQRCPRLCCTTECCSVVGSAGSYFMSHPSAGNPATKRRAVSTCDACSQPETSDGAVGMGTEGRSRMFTDPLRAAQGAGAGGHLLQQCKLVWHTKAQCKRGHKGPTKPWQGGCSSRHKPTLPTCFTGVAVIYSGGCLAWHTGDALAALVRHSQAGLLSGRKGTCVT